jgi:hypothetical protein
MMAANSIKIKIDAEEFIEAANRLSDALDASRLIWRTMETAPKDGTPFLGCANKDLPVVTWYDVDHYWSYSTLSGGEYVKWQPTHWMPLPKPPEDSNA